jgi:DNA end-binding protein Ku
MPDADETIDLEQIARGRPIWTGTVSFGLVSVPVNIMPATRPSAVSLHMVSDRGEPLRRKYYAPRNSLPRSSPKTRNSRSDDGRELTQDEIVRGYEWKKGKFVVLEDEELERIAPEQTRNIDLRVFVKADEIDPMYFVRAYYLTPVGSPKAYKLLARVMEERGRAGIATFVMRAKEYVAAILAENDILRLETLRFADEIRSPAQVGLPKPERPHPADVNKLEGMIKRLTKTSLDARDLEDESAEKLEALAKRKAKKGEDVVDAPETDEEEPQTTVIDLMDRLQQSLRSQGTSRHGGKARA